MHHTRVLQEAMRTLLPLVLVFCDEEEELAPPVDRLAGVVVVATLVALAVLVVDAALTDGDDVVDVDDTLSFFWLDMVAVDRHAQMQSAEPNPPCLSTQAHARSSHTSVVMYLQPNRHDLNLAVVVGCDLLPTTTTTRDASTKHPRANPGVASFVLRG